MLRGGVITKRKEEEETYKGSGSLLGFAVRSNLEGGEVLEGGRGGLGGEVLGVLLAAAVANPLLRALVVNCTLLLTSIL